MEKLAKEIVNLVMNDLTGRSGIFDGIDYDIQEEIKADLDALVLDKLQKAKKSGEI